MAQDIFKEKPWNVAERYTMTLGERYTTIIDLMQDIKAPRGRMLFLECHARVKGLLLLLMASPRFNPDNLQKLIKRLGNIPAGFSTQNYKMLEEIIIEIGLLYADKRVMEFRAKTIKSDKVMSQAMR